MQYIVKDVYKTDKKDEMDKIIIKIIKAIIINHNILTTQ